MEIKVENQITIKIRDNDDWDFTSVIVEKLDKEGYVIKHPYGIFTSAELKAIAKQLDKLNKNGN